MKNVDAGTGGDVVAANGVVVVVVDDFSVGGQYVQVISDASVLHKSSAHGEDLVGFSDCREPNRIKRDVPLV